MQSAQYYANTVKAEEYDQKAEAETSPLLKRSLVLVTREYGGRVKQATGTAA